VRTASAGRPGASGSGIFCRAAASTRICTGESIGASTTANSAAPRPVDEVIGWSGWMKGRGDGRASSPSAAAPHRRRRMDMVGDNRAEGFFCSSRQPTTGFDQTREAPGLGRIGRPGAPRQTGLTHHPLHGRGAAPRRPGVTISPRRIVAAAPPGPRRTARGHWQTNPYREGGREVARVEDDEAGQDAARADRGGAGARRDLDGWK